ncbi:hypothetical protein Poli38472_013366 [Pythium oligandrum]|uniref:Uncharacterized protein n=1 Tax=Pythium oligandrum TaxID=41045 RepID=A0A8K1C7C8_PYTOL|nr:hypothetical protein Poli38472_013366 [Pythium oligandrum]|eukprot:TMW57892.1 hypothetical protein Poli38472_013366 [Pythium oligandrum]
MFHVYADSAAQRPLFDIKAKFSVVNSMLDVKFENLVSKRQCRMGYDGDWKVRNAVLWLDPGDGQILTVARIYRPTVTDRNIVLGKQDYYVDVPPNIDLALIVLLCIALDEARND